MAHKQASSAVQVSEAYSGQTEAATAYSHIIGQATA